MKKLYKIIGYQIILILLMVPLLGSDNNGNGVEDYDEETLAEKFAPTLIYHEGNPLFPMAIDDIYTLQDFSNYTTHVPLPIENHSPEGWKNYFEETLEPQNLQPTVYYI